MEKLYLTEKDYIVIRGAAAAEAEIYAAQELAEYFRKITGRTLPVRTDEDAEGEYEIVVGRTNRNGMPVTEGLGEDGFVLRTVGEKLFLTGGDPETRSRLIR
ncbi:MAG: hypothetical protein IKZ41_05390, partial [Clostridia bacterium]|nr:hypothetical protein [Clostridia bacterium]